MTDVVGGNRTGTQLLVQGGETHVRMVLEACLAEAERALGNDDGVHEQLFREALVAGVRHDQQVNSPDTLGIDNEGQDTAHRMSENYFVTRGGSRVN